MKPGKTTTKKISSRMEQAQIRRVLEHYESQTDEEAAAEIESGLKNTTMEVPTALLPVVRGLIAKRKSTRAHGTRTHKRRVAANKSRAA